MSVLLAPGASPGWGFYC